MGIPTAYKRGYENGKADGYILALKDVNLRLRNIGIEDVSFNWTDLGNGKYNVSMYYQGKVFAMGKAEVHLWIEHRRNGVLLAQEFGAGVLTTDGQDYIEKQLSGTLNSSQHALYLSDSNDATDPPLNSWHVLPSEITTNGLDRQTGTYTSTGVGAWNVTVTKTATGTQSTQLWGINFDPTDGSSGYLLAADSGPSQKNMVSGDTLKETWQISVT